MGRVPTTGGFARDMLRRDESLRSLRARTRGHTESKTFIVGGPIITGMFIPPLFVAINGDSETPEWKTVCAFRAQLNAGVVTIAWKHRHGGTVTTLATQEVTTDPAHDPFKFARGAEFDLKDLDTLQVEVTFASDAAADLAAAVFMAAVGT